MNIQEFATVRPRAKSELTSLIIQWKEGDVNFTRARENHWVQPRYVPVMLHNQARCGAASVCHSFSTENKTKSDLTLAKFTIIRRITFLFMSYNQNVAQTLTIVNSTVSYVMLV